MPKKRRSQRYPWVCPKCSRRFRVLVGRSPDLCPKCAAEQTYTEGEPPPPTWLKHPAASRAKKHFKPHEERQWEQPTSSSSATHWPRSLEWEAGHRTEVPRIIRECRPYVGAAIGMAAIAGLLWLAHKGSLTTPDLGFLRTLVRDVCLFLCMIVLALFAFLPTVIAYSRGHHNRVPILIVNILLFWTGIAWVVALIWAFTSQPTQVHHYHKRP